MYYVASNGFKTAVIERDPERINPRDPEYQENLSQMVCWHRRYDLGDKHTYEGVDSFAEDMASEYLSMKDITQAIKDGKLSGLRLEPEKDANQNDCYRVMFLDGPRLGNHWEETDIVLSADLEPLDEWITIEDFFGYCPANDLIQLCTQTNKVAVLPLYLYDHSGITISTGSFEGRAPHARWDSGQVGYIYMDKETAMSNLCMPGNEVRVAMEGEFSSKLLVESDKHIEFDKVMEEKGYVQVKREDITNLDEHPKLGYFADGGTLFKKDHKLYVMQERHADCSYSIQAIATYNPNMLGLTEETWRSRAEEIMRAEVQEYDNYLTGEIYGYRLFEGLDEVDSCWGFNPGSEDIRELIADELTGWFGSEMKFETSYNEEFDIDVFLSDHDFPQLRNQIYSEVLGYLATVENSATIYPFQISAESLRANQGGVLTGIVNELYDEHTPLTQKRIQEAFCDHAGVSRAVKPKISVADLDPNLDYTADEVMEILSKKPSLDSLIAGASAKRGAPTPGHTPGRNGQPR